MSALGVLSNLLGGVGLFLFGVVLLTDGVKALTEHRLRQVLLRFTGGPLKAVATGTVVTALLQSSSATTVMTIGFVSAGLLALPQAIGMVLGANLGTTGTGWLVALVGLKFSVSVVAMPLVGVGALMRLTLAGRWRPLGVAIAGFGLVFVGIDALQAGMAGAVDYLDPAAFPGETWTGRALLVLIGAAITVVLQSSSAAVAMTLAALHAGNVSLLQAAALVVGQNLGTTVTAGLAALGATAAAKRAAWAHIAFNGVTAILAYALLPLFVWLVATIAADVRSGDQHAVALAAFHTLFNLLGVVLFLPFVGLAARALVRLIPERGSALTADLDQSLHELPPVALETVRQALARAAQELLAQTVDALATRRAHRHQRDRALDEITAASDRIQDYLHYTMCRPRVGRRQHSRCGLRCCACWTINGAWAICCDVSCRVMPRWPTSYWR